MAREDGHGMGARLARITRVTPKASSKWLNGEARPGHDKLVALSKWLNVREEWLEYGHEPMRKSGATSASYRVEEHAQELAQLASPRSLRMLNNIAQAAQDGRLTEDDLTLLEQIANRIAARPAEHTYDRRQSPHERLKAKLGNNDSSAERNRPAGPSTEPDANGD
ncbi:helix-turn-helix domain-containing protein [Halomonas sp. HMF6819]|uniref:helix-turn-helix domain-containing protein n=1 Tax=Halomonas sp. HMF6819 TaxID=3373085 RepID=UPI0037920DEA